MSGMNRSGSVRAKWTRIIAEQRSRGVSVAGFCEARGISASSMFAWTQKLA